MGKKEEEFLENTAATSPVEEGMEETRLRLPHRKELEIFGVITQLHGADKVGVMGEDGVQRICRIPGKLRKRVWLRENDVVIIKLWDFQKSKADVMWRFMGPQTERLKRQGFLKNLKV